MNFPPKTILVPTDFSEGAERAASYAFEMAAQVGAQVHLLNAYQISVYPGDRSMAGRLMDELQALGEKGLKELAAKYPTKGAAGQQLVKVGDPRDVIIATASELHADLIVMGTQGRRGLKRMFIGSVAEAVVRTAPCAVLVVPPAPEKGD
jgi:nucleotide-binding universal stress UspA family protein